VLVSTFGWRAVALGVFLDSDQNMKLGVRTYVNARVGTEHTDKMDVVEVSTQKFSKLVQRSRTFPISPPGHLRQNRFFIEAELDHNVTKLMRQGFGPLALLNDLPFGIRQLKYHLTFRGEGDGIYDWGPREYRTADQFQQLFDSDPYDRLSVERLDQKPNSCTLQSCPRVRKARRDLRRKAVHRERLYQAYIDLTAGDLSLRLGRQILVWGETDAFRLLDNINPIDSSFGGFLISLDERRVPLDMIRASYYLGELGRDVTEASVEVFAAIDRKVSFAPGVPEGSPWALPNLGEPSATTRGFTITPARTIANTRGGGRFSFDALGATFSLAHYYTFSDLPAVQTCTHPNVAPDAQLQERYPVARLSSRNEFIRTHGGIVPGCPIAPLDEPEPTREELAKEAARGGDFDIFAPNAFAIQLPAKIQISGATATFTIPATISRRLGLSGEPVIRSELAYIKDEPYHRQSQVDPYLYNCITTEGGICPATGRPRTATGGILKRDSINFVLGVDTNQFFRFLNPVNSFFISTQFFYKHIKGWDPEAVLPVPASTHLVKKVDPATGQLVFDPAAEFAGATDVTLIKTDRDQFLHTLFISTSYLSGMINPSFTLFYDWSGGIVYIPSVQFWREPFRLVLEYDILDAGSLKGNSGVSLLRDRDNLLFQLEYVI